MKEFYEKRILFINTLIPFFKKITIVFNINFKIKAKQV